MISIPGTKCSKCGNYLIAPSCLYCEQDKTVVWFAEQQTYKHPKDYLDDYLLLKVLMSKKRKQDKALKEKLSCKKAMSILMMLDEVHQEQRKPENKDKQFSEVAYKCCKK